MRSIVVAACFVLTAVNAAVPAAAQDKPQAPPQDRPAESPTPGAIRNAPSPRALEFVAYIYSASNVCGFRIGVPAFEAQLAKQNVRAADVGPRGPFGNRVMGMFTLMSNEMAQNREAACIAVAGEYGPEGSLAKDVLLPGDPAADPAGKPKQ